MATAIITGASQGIGACIAFGVNADFGTIDAVKPCDIIVKEIMEQAEKLLNR